MRKKVLAGFALSLALAVGVVTASLWTAAPSSAGVSDVPCYLFGSLATEMATNRDVGIPLVETQRVIINGMSDVEVRDFLLKLAILIYETPEVTPEQAGESVTKICHETQQETDVG
jgi:hypothetical protein